MSVTAKSLSKSGARGHQIDAMVRDVVNMIDGRLQQHPRTWGRNVAQIELARSFNIPGLDLSDGQLLIYSAIIRQYEERGFEVGLDLQEKATILYVAWVTDLSSEEVESMKALVSGRLLAGPEGVLAFREKGRAPRRGEGEAPRLRVGKGREVLPRGGVAPAAPKNETTPAENAILGLI